MELRCFPNFNDLRPKQSRVGWAIADGLKAGGVIAS